MWVTKLMISQVKKRIFCPKTTKFGPKLAFLGNLGQAMQAYSVLCWWVGWWLWRAGCISQDTYLLYITLIVLLDQPSTRWVSILLTVPFTCLWSEWSCQWSGQWSFQCEPLAGPQKLSSNSVLRNS